MTRGKSQDISRHGLHCGSEHSLPFMASLRHKLYQAWRVCVPDIVEGPGPGEHLRRSRDSSKSGPRSWCAGLKIKQEWRCETDRRGCKVPVNCSGRPSMSHWRVTLSSTWEAKRSRDCGLRESPRSCVLLSTLCKMRDRDVSVVACSKEIILPEALLERSGLSLVLTGRVRFIGAVTKVCSVSGWHIFAIPQLG